MRSSLLRSLSAVLVALLMRCCTMSTWCRCWYRGAVELVRSRSPLTGQRTRRSPHGSGGSVSSRLRLLQVLAAAQPIQLGGDPLPRTPRLRLIDLCADEHVVLHLHA